MTKSIVAPLPDSLPLPPFSRFVMDLALTLARWEMNLRTRKALEKLDAAQLRDIGLTTDQARTEWDKPFWWG